MTATLPADGTSFRSHTGSVIVLQITTSAGGNALETRIPQAKSRSRFTARWRVWSNPATRMWATPSSSPAAGSPGHARDTKVTAWPREANILARPYQDLSVAPPLTGGTGRKNPVTMLILNGSGRISRRR
jgi:hypothetical protein